VAVHVHIAKGTCFSVRNSLWYDRTK